MHASDGYLIAIYVIYAATSIGLIVWLGRTLFRNGAVFLLDVFEGRPEMAHAVNKLLVTGFYMLDLGFAFLLLENNAAPDAVRAVEILVRKLGILLLLLGCLHMINMLVFQRIRHRAQLAKPAPPLQPQARWPATQADDQATWPPAQAAAPPAQPPDPLDPSSRPARPAPPA